MGLGWQAAAQERKLLPVLLRLGSPRQPCQQVCEVGGRAVGGIVNTGDPERRGHLEGENMMGGPLAVGNKVSSGPSKGTPTTMEWQGGGAG